MMETGKMYKLLIFAFSEQGKKLAEQIEYALSSDSFFIRTEVFCEAVRKVSYKAGDVLNEQFDLVDGILFIGATGIAVRLIAPFLTHKAKDPAVLVVDEKGVFCISLVSGHLGGANELAEKIAECINGIPVITTATDRNGLFSVDDFARKNELKLSDLKKAKMVSADLLAGKRVAVITDERLPNSSEVSIRLSDENMWDQTSLYLVPRSLIVGIGCRKGTENSQLQNAVTKAFSKMKLNEKAIRAFASIDLKKDEAGLLALAEEYGSHLHTFSAEELEKVSGDFSESSFVEQVTGVSNVCERSAVCLARRELQGLANAGYEVVLPKTIIDGVTISIVRLFEYKTEV